MQKSIIDDSMIMCDEIIETAKSVLTKTVPSKKVFKTNLNKKSDV